MISSRRIALLGIGYPLSPVMLAVLGLWPEEEDTPRPPMFGFLDPLGGGGGRKAKAAPQVAPEPKRKPPEADDDQPRIRRQNDLILSLVMAAVTEELV